MLLFWGKKKGIVFCFSSKSHAKIYYQLYDLITIFTLEVPTLGNYIGGQISKGL